jgi:glutamate-1-semialdehyde 2,1-aminomutase
MGKIIGGGLPVGAYGGRKEIMSMLAPIGPVYQAGTLSGNPLAMAAGLAMLKTLNCNANFYADLEAKAARLETGLKKNLERTGHKAVINRIGSMMTLFFTELTEVKSFEQVMKSDKDKYARYFHLCLQSGVYLGPSQFEAFFVSAAHTNEDIDRTIALSLEALKQL